MSDHSTLGASGSHRWINCPGSVAMIEEAPDDRSSTYADGGTAAHEIMSRCLNKGVDADLFLDTVIQVEDMSAPVTVDEEMVEAVQVVLDYVAKKLAEGWTLHGVEVRFDLSPLNPPGPMYGRADVVLKRDGAVATKTTHASGQPMVTLPKPLKLEVIDMKYGVGVVVQVERNSQLMYYALGAVVELNEIPGELTSTVIQPRALHPDGIVRSWTYPYEHLKEFKGALFSAAERTQDPGAPLAVGDWCRFCPAQAVCPEQLNAAQSAAQREFGELVVVEEGDDHGQQFPAPAVLSRDELVDVLGKAHMVEAWLKAVRNHVRDLTEAGEDTGYKLVPKRGRRLFRDVEAAERNLVNDLGNAAYTPRKLKSVTQAEKAYKVHGIKLPGDAWHMVSSGTNLVPDTDPRPAVPALPSAAEEFEVVGDCDKGLPVTTEPEEESAPEIELKVWEVQAPGHEVFFVTGDTLTEAKEEARLTLQVARLPNHTEVTPS